MDNLIEYVVRDADGMRWTQYAPASAKDAIELAESLTEQYAGKRYAPFTAHIRTTTEAPLASPSEEATP